MNLANIKFKNIVKYSEEKKKFLLFGLVLFLCLFLAVYMLRIAYARYEVNAKLKSDLNRALYIFETEKLEFNLETGGLVPSETPYIYKFSVSNFNDEKVSELDLEYNVTVKTTTNMPITLEIYKLDDDANEGDNLVTGASRWVDVDSAIYNLYKVPDTYDMSLNVKTTDYFVIKINYPIEYKNSMTYEDTIENIDVILESKQVI